MIILHSVHSYRPSIVTPYVTNIKAATIVSVE